MEKFRLLWTLILEENPVPEMHVTWLDSQKACALRLGTIIESYNLHEDPFVFFSYSIVDRHGRTLSSDAFYNGDWTVPDDPF